MKKSRLIINLLLANAFNHTNYSEEPREGGREYEAFEESKIYQ